MSRHAGVRAFVPLALAGAVALAGTAALAAFASAKEIRLDSGPELDAVPVVRQAWHRAPFERLEVSFPVGTLEIVGTDRDSIVLVLEPDGRRGSWEDRARVSRRIGVRAHAHGRTLELSVLGKRWFDTSRVQILGRIEVPRALALQVDMKVGELAVAGVGPNAEFRLAVGEATVRRPERGLESARVDVAIGEALLVQGGRSRDRAGAFGNGLRWREGRGTGTLALRVGIGEASVYLD